MRAALFMAAALTVGDTVAVAQEAERDFIIISDTRASPDCTSETARRSSFTDALAAAEADKRCVVLEGLWIANHFYDGVDGYYQAKRSGIPDLGFSPFRLGVYGWLDRIELPDIPLPARLAGRVGDCDDLVGPDVISVSGYCHNVSGGYIALGSAEVTGPTPDRLLGAETRAAMGQLLEPPEGWPHRTYVESQVWTWLGRLRSGDIAAYAAATGLADYNADPNEPYSDAHALFREPGSVFDRLRDEPVADLRIWLFAPRERSTDEPPANPTDVDALACFRLGHWTEDRWPVAFVDADNAPERPYACVAMSRETLGGQIDERLDVPHSSRGLAEPTHFPPERPAP